MGRSAASSTYIAKDCLTGLSGRGCTYRDLMHQGMGMQGGRGLGVCVSQRRSMNVWHWGHLLIALDCSASRSCLSRGLAVSETWPSLSPGAPEHADCVSPAAILKAWNSLQAAISSFLTCYHHPSPYLSPSLSLTAYLTCPFSVSFLTNLFCWGPR